MTDWQTDPKMNQTSAMDHYRFIRPRSNSKRFSDPKKKHQTTRTYARRWNIRFEFIQVNPNWIGIDNFFLVYFFLFVPSCPNFLSFSLFVCSLIIIIIYLFVWPFASRINVIRSRGSDRISSRIDGLDSDNGQSEWSE